MHFVHLATTLLLKVEESAQKRHMPAYGINNNNYYYIICFLADPTGNGRTVFLWSPGRLESH